MEMSACITLEAVTSTTVSLLVFVHVYILSYLTIYIMVYYGQSAAQCYCVEKLPSL